MFGRVAAYSATLVDQQNHADRTGAFERYPQGAWYFFFKLKKGKGKREQPFKVFIFFLFFLSPRSYHSGEQLLRMAPCRGLRMFHSASEFDLGYNLSTTPVTDPSVGQNNTAGDPNAWTDGHHNWVTASNRTAAALNATATAYRHLYALGAHHCDSAVLLHTLADTLVWLWAAA